MPSNGILNMKTDPNRPLLRPCARELQYRRADFATGTAIPRPWS